MKFGICHVITVFSLWDLISKFYSRINLNKDKSYIFLNDR